MTLGELINNYAPFLYGVITLTFATLCIWIAIKKTSKMKLAILQFEVDKRRREELFKSLSYILNREDINSIERGLAYAKKYNEWQFLDLPLDPSQETWDLIEIIEKTIERSRYNGAFNKSGNEND